LTGEGLTEGLGASQALCRAAAILRDLTRSQIIEHLEGMPGADGLAEIIDRYRSSRIEHGMFSHPYICGGLSVYALL
jgi:hypothetical protein